jgi:hypothetical protein
MKRTGHLMLCATFMHVFPLKRLRAQSKDYDLKYSAYRRRSCSKCQTDSADHQMASTHHSTPHACSFPSAAVIMYEYYAQ